MKMAADDGDEGSQFSNWYVKSLRAYAESPTDCLACIELEQGFCYENENPSVPHSPSCNAPLLAVATKAVAKAK